MTEQTQTKEGGLVNLIVRMPKQKPERALDMFVHIELGNIGREAGTYDFHSGGYIVTDNQGKSALTSGYDENGKQVLDHYELVRSFEKEGLKLEGKWTPLVSCGWLGFDIQAILKNRFGFRKRVEKYTYRTQTPYEALASILGIEVPEEFKEDNERLREEPDLQPYIEEKTFYDMTEDIPTQEAGLRMRARVAEHWKEYDPKTIPNLIWEAA